MNNPIISNPENVIGSLGESITLSTKVQVGTDFDYEWSRSAETGTVRPVLFETIPNATGSSLTINNLISSGNHLYWYQLTATHKTTKEEFTSNPTQIGVYPDASNLNVTGLPLYVYANNLSTELVVYPSSSYSYIWEKQEITNTEELDLKKYVHVTGGSSNKLSLTNLDLGDHYSLYRVTVSGATESWVSPPITVIFDPSININQENIQDFTLPTDGKKRLYVIAQTANGNIEYSWQRSINNGPFIDIDGEENNYIDLSGLTSANIGDKYRVELTSDVSKVYTKYSKVAEILQIPPNPEYGPITITNQPQEYAYITNTGVSLNCIGSYNYTFGGLWLKSTDKVLWTTVVPTEGYQTYTNADPLNSILNIEYSGFEDKKEYYRCRFFNENEGGNIVSNITTVDYNIATYATVNPPTGITAINGALSLTCDYFQNQTGVYDYNWYRFPIEGTNIMQVCQTGSSLSVSNTSLGGALYRSTLQLNSLSVDNNDGDRYAFVAKDKSTQNIVFISSQTKVTVPNTLSIVTNLPDKIRIPDGTNESVSVNVTTSLPSPATVSYQWYESSDNGQTFNPILGATSNSISITASQNNHKHYYRVQASDGLNTIILK